MNKNYPPPFIPALNNESAELLANQVNVLTLEEKYLLKQYTHHGDEIINNYMRGIDDINTYKKNILHPLSSNHTFFCVLLLEFDPTALQNSKNFDDGNITIQNLRHNRKFMTYYKHLYNIINRAFEGEDALANLRSMTRQVIKKLINILKKRPVYLNPLVTYRGAKENYLKNIDEVSVLGSFYSTSLIEEVTKPFGKFIYKFVVHPMCVYMYIEPITDHPEEFEILIGPTNRIVKISDKILEGFDNAEDMFYFILPPKDATQNNTAMVKAGENAFLTLLSDTAKIQKNYNTFRHPFIYENNEAAAAGGGGGGAAVAGGGGGGAAKAKAKTRRGGKRKQKRKTRSRKTRKQRGGAELNLDPMNRWMAEPVIVAVEDLDQDDLNMIKDMLGALKQKNSRNSIFSLNH
jgi:hypothetical protein